MKRKLTLFLSAVMATSCLPITAYAANFKDIDDVPWAGASAVINSVADKGLLSGYEDGTFRARNNVTYCETMQMVYTTMVKSGAASSMDAVSVYGYMQSLDVLNVPKWAQMAVAYGLSEGIIDMQMVATKFAGGNKTATREDVAIIFGNAVGCVFGKERDTSNAKTFADYWNISANAMEQVSMLKKLNILSGDDYNRFNPKKNINRAEMAVMLNNTYGIMAEGIGMTGEIIELDVNQGMDGTYYYYMVIESEDGRKESFNVTDGKIPVYKGSGNETIAMNKLSKGDDVSIVFSGLELLSIRQLDATSAQEKYDVTGFIETVKNNILTLENENTGESAKYKIFAETLLYVDGEKVHHSRLDDILKERYKEYAYAGVNTEIKREKIGGNYQDVVYAKEIHVTFVEEYSVIGEVATLTETNITMEMAGGNVKKNYIIADDCVLTIDGETADYDEMKALMSDGTAFAKVKLNNADKAISIDMSADSFADSKEEEESKLYTVTALSSSKLVLEDSGDEKITYNFGSENPLSNIRFYSWDAPAADWESISDEDARDYADAEKYTNKDGYPTDVTNIYAKIEFNDGGKLDAVYLSAVRNAWKVSDETTSEREGVVASIEEDVLKFKTSKVEYTLLRKYADGKLLIEGAPTSSKTVLTRMANDEGIKLYAEVTANGDNEVTEIKARATEAVGKLVEWDRDKKVIEIETKDGNTFKLKTQKNPKLTDEDEGYFDLDDLAGPMYKGDWIELGFTGSGIVDTFTMVDGPKNLDQTDRVKGIATGADNGLVVDGKTYPWLGKTSEIEVSNLSCPQTSLTVVKDLIEDPDVEVYVEATLNDDGKVDSIKLTVKKAEGELTDFGTSVRILTDAGNRFSFNRKAELAECDINGVDQTELEEYGRGIGENVLLTFTDRGEVNKIEDK